MAEALVLFREVDIKEAVLPEKVVDKNIRETLTGWISCGGLTTEVAESHSIRHSYEGYAGLLTMMNTGIGQRYDSVSLTAGLSLLVAQHNKTAFTN